MLAKISSLVTLLLAMVSKLFFLVSLGLAQTCSFSLSLLVLVPHFSAAIWELFSYFPWSVSIFMLLGLPTAKRCSSAEPQESRTKMLWLQGCSMQQTLASFTVSDMWAGMKGRPVISHRPPRAEFAPEWVHSYCNSKKFWTCTISIFCFLFSFSVLSSYRFFFPITALETFSCCTSQASGKHNNKHICWFYFIVFT